MKTNKIIRVFQVLFLMLALSSAGCGSGDSGSSGPGGAGQNSSSSSYQYLMCENCSDGNGNCYTSQSQCYGGCTTGQHSYSDLTSACNALSSDSQNNGCASQNRQQMFQSLGCPGSFGDY